MKKLELLAPAGNMDALRAAVNNGADAIYLGGDQFGARAFAGNFDKDSLKKAIEYAHVRDVKIFVTANTLVKEREVEEFLNYANFLYKQDVDAVIVQDLGMANILRKEFSDMDIHASTQMTTNSLEDVMFLKNMGFKRAVLSRELTLDEISKISNESDIELEVFVHGALCVGYSGQCLMSSIIGGRSGNRGRCAQPCRMEYELKDLAGNKNTVKKGNYILSPRDLSTLSDLEAIVKSGVNSLKIEGRMKRPEYVATAVKNYKDALDHISRNLEYDYKEKEDEIYSIFNRDFTRGYILNQRGEAIINSQKPSNKGVLIGEVVKLSKERKRIGIKLEKNIQKRDGLSLGEHVGRILFEGKETTEGFEGQTIELDFIGKASIGDLVYRTYDSKIMKVAEASYQTDSKKVGISGKLELQIDKLPKLIVSDSRGNVLEVEGETLCEKATNVATSKERLEEQVKKTNDTPFYFENLELEVEDGLRVAIKEINSLRRSALEELEEKRKNCYKREEKTLNYNKSKKNTQKFYGEDTKIRVKVTSLEQLEEVLNYDFVERIYIKDMTLLKKAQEIVKSEDIFLEYPRVKRDTKDYQNLDISGRVVHNLGSLLKKDIETVGSYGFNIYNSNTASVLADFCSELNPSIELNKWELKELIEEVKNPDMLEVKVYGNIPVMITEACPFKDEVGKCKEKTCQLKAHTLKSKEKFHSYYMEREENCRVILYTKENLNLLEEVEELENFGFSKFRVDFLYETQKDVKSTMENLKSVLNGSSIRVSGEDYTKGHYYKGVE